MAKAMGFIVDRLGHGTEHLGFAMTIARVSFVNNVTHAQGASYLDQCLEFGCFKWNSEHGIRWRIISSDIYD
jgi:hypothetical protein